MAHVVVDLRPQVLHQLPCTVRDEPNLRLVPERPVQSEVRAYLLLRSQLWPWPQLHVGLVAQLVRSRLRCLLHAQRNAIDERLGNKVYQQRPVPMERLGADPVKHVRGAVPVPLLDTICLHNQC